MDSSQNSSLYLGALVHNQPISIAIENPQQQLQTSLLSGMVLDDYSDSGCIKVKDCKCTLKGKHYDPGTVISSECEEWYNQHQILIVKNNESPHIAQLY